MTERTAKILIVFIPVILFIGLFLNYISVFGEKTVRHEMGDSSPFVQRLLPDERVSEVMNNENGDAYVELLDEPVYFSVFAPPGNFERVTARVYFQAEDEAIFELGALKDLFAQAFDLRPFANNILTNLTEQGWLSRPLEGLDVGTVFARTEEALENWSELPATEIATYRKSLPVFPVEYHASEQTESPWLKGSHEFFLTVSHDKSVNAKLLYYSFGTTPGQDDLSFKVYSASGDLINEQTVTNISLGFEGLAYPHLDFTQTLEAGLYRIVISTTSDITFMLTTSDPFVIKNSVNIGKGSNDVELYTNAKAITVEPKNAEALGEVTFGNQKVTMTSVGEKVKLTATEDAPSRLILNDTGAVRITGEGFFSPTREHFFAPEASGFSNFIADPDSFSAVVAQVPEVQMEGDWQVGEASFELSTLAMERGAYKFVLSAPQVEEENGGVKVHAIELTFEKDVSVRSFLSSIKRFIKELVF